MRPTYVYLRLYTIYFLSPWDEMIGRWADARDQLGRSRRPSLKSQQGDARDTTTASETNAEANSPRAKISDTTRLQPDSLVLEAPMGGLGMRPFSRAQRGFLVS